MVMGGVPQYLKMINRGESITQTIEHICFSKDGFLKDEFNNLFLSLFNNAHEHIAVIKALAKKGNGLTRNEIIQQCKLKTGGGTTQLLDELRESGFIEPYIPFGKNSKNRLYKLIDEYSLFYVKFIQNEKNNGPNSGILFANSPSWISWSGIAFENICLKHVYQLKVALGISAVLSQHYVWRTPKTENNHETGAQIDLIIDRNDHCINICEIKFSKTQYEITQKYSMELQNKLLQFQNHSQTHKTLFLTLITTYGIKNISQYQGLIPCHLSMDSLFK
jgi:hypothetical protein